LIDLVGLLHDKRSKFGRTIYFIIVIWLRSGVVPLHGSRGLGPPNIFKRGKIIFE